MTSLTTETPKVETPDEGIAVDRTSRMIVAKDVRWPAHKDGTRSFDKAAAAKLAQSLATEGLHQPILVMPDAAKPGHYVGVFGKHRHYAASDILKWELIEARVCPMSDEEAEMARLSENYLRSPQTKAQLAKTVSRWHELYEKRHDEYRAAVKAAKVANNRKADRAYEKKHFPEKVQVGPESPDEPVVIPERPGSFVKETAAALNVSPTTIKRQLKIGSAFTEQEAEILDAKGVPQVMIETIADIPNDGQRSEVVRRITDGQEPVAALAEVTKPEDGVILTASGTVKNFIDRVKDEDSLDDQAWVNVYCKTLLGRLPHKAAYTADCILYRKTRDHRQTLHAKTRKAMAACKEGNALGPLYRALSKFLMIGHPSTWLLCSKCQGHGIVAIDNTTCRPCGGNGYIMTYDS